MVTKTLIKKVDYNKGKLSDEDYTPLESNILQPNKSELWPKLESIGLVWFNTISGYSFHGMMSKL